MGKTKRKHNTVALNVFPTETALTRIFFSMDVDKMLQEIERQLKEAVENFGLDAKDPEKLYHQERYLNMSKWPEDKRAAVEAYYGFHQAKRCIKANDAKWTAYHMLTVIKQISYFNLLAFDPQISLGEKLLLAQQQGGLASGAVRREASKIRKEWLIGEAKKLLSDGISKRELVGILSRRVSEYSKSSIRKTLLEADLLSSQRKA